MAKGSDPYGSQGSVPQNVPGPSGSGLSPLGLRADANNFGGQIGAAMEKSGAQLRQTADDISTQINKHIEQATEAKVNDDYANKYMPAALELRTKYDSLQGQDKIHGYEEYTNGLRTLNQQFMKGAKNPYEQKMWNGLTNDMLVKESNNASRDLAASQIEFSNRAAADKIAADSGYAAANYNNPQLISDTINKIDNTILLQNIDNGLDPNTPEHREVIEQAQNVAKGNLAEGMIQRALETGDAAAAVAIRQRFDPFIPGYKQLSIDNVLHREDMRQTGFNGAKALQAGDPMPSQIGAPPATVQAIVADAAQTHGIDPNHALTVAWIESAMGQNVGTRGDIGQTGKGGELPEQATNMVVELKKSQDVATKALGRVPEPWETYTCYQQGASGGPALLRASTDNPKAKAVDILAPLYKDRKTAMSAIINNGGNASMTSGDYLQFIKKKYNDNAARALCVVPEGQEVPQATPEGTTLLSQPTPPSLGSAILKPHEETGEVVQPASSPRQQLLNFDQKFPDMMVRAQAIPNVAVREAVITNLKQDRNNLAGAATAYSSKLINDAHTLAQDPKFTSEDQIPSELSAELLENHPDTLSYLRNKAEDNLNKSHGAVTQDMKTYGPGYFNLFRDVHEGVIKSPTELMSYLPKDGDTGSLTVAGYEKLVGEFTKDPESQADAAMRAQSFKVIKSQLSAEDEALGIIDSPGEALFSQAMPKLYQAIDEGKAKGLTIGELTDPTNPNWIGNAVKSLKRTPTQMAIDSVNGKDDKEKPKRQFFDMYQNYLVQNDEGKQNVRDAVLAMSPHDIALEYKNATPERKMVLKQALEDFGLIKKTDKNVPSVPIQ